MTQDKLSFNTIGGPSKFDMMLSLFDGNKEPRRTVEFQLEGARAPITVYVTSVQQEDGSGESWNFEGGLTNYRRGFHLRGYYSSKSRTGHITFIFPFHYVMKGDKRHKIVRPEDQRELEEYIDWLRGKGTGWPIPNAHVYTTHRD